MNFGKIAASLLFFGILSLTSNAHSQSIDNRVRTYIDQYFNHNFLTAKNDSDRLSIHVLKNFFWNLTFEDIYRLHRINQDPNLNHSLDLKELLSLPISQHAMTLHSRNRSYKENPNTTNPIEYDHILEVWKEWPVTSLSHGTFSTDLILEEATHLFKKISSESSFGEIYEITFHPRLPGFFKSQAVYLDAQQQSLIDQIFLNSERLTEIKTPEILVRISSGQLTETEVRELESISMAFSQFENLTFLKGDKGGWSGNLLGSFQKSPEQSLCHEEALTSEFFLRTLEKRGLLRNFSVRGTILRFNHEAALIQSKRTQEYLVVDSWFDDGGHPARIYSEHDWSKKDDKKYFLPIH